MPTFVGGDPALRRYLATHLLYPAEAVRQRLSGTVVMQFVVDEQGRLFDIAVVRTSNEVFAAEALRVARLMPRWVPGQQQGKPVRVQYTLPIAFTFKPGESRTEQ